MSTLFINANITSKYDCSYSLVLRRLHDRRTSAHKSKFDVILPLQLSDSKFSKLVCLNLREREKTTDAPSSAAVIFNLWSALPLRNLAAYVALWWLTKHIFAEIAARCLDYPICCYLSLPSPSPPIGVCARGWHDFPLPLFVRRRRVPQRDRASPLN